VSARPSFAGAPRVQPLHRRLGRPLPKCLASLASNAVGVLLAVERPSPYRLLSGAKPDTLSAFLPAVPLSSLAVEGWRCRGLCVALAVFATAGRDLSLWRRVGFGVTDGALLCDSTLWGCRCVDVAIGGVEGSHRSWRPPVRHVAHLELVLRERSGTYAALSVVSSTRNPSCGVPRVSATAGRLSRRDEYRHPRSKR
jgi:hypothetical protein